MNERTVLALSTVITKRQQNTGSSKRKLKGKRMENKRSQTLQGSGGFSGMEDRPRLRKDK